MSKLTNFLNTVSALDKFCVLDTETTGLRNAEICQIAIIDNHSNVLLDTLVKPLNSIPQDATRIHGINDEMVKEAPTWCDVIYVVGVILEHETCLIYNDVYDLAVMQYSSDVRELSGGWWNTAAAYVDVMKPFAELYGDWNEYHKSYTWKSLEVAARYLNVPVIATHSALGDCRMTLAVTLEMIHQHEIQQKQNASK